jgi:hypothetical protein
MKTLILAAIRCSLMFTAVTSLFCVQPAQAYTVTLEQIGSNVVATGSGPINLTGLTLSFPGAISGAVVFASVGQIETGLATALVEVTQDSSDRRVSGAEVCFFPTLAAGTLSALMLQASRSSRCHRAMSPVLLYRTA